MATKTDNIPEGQEILRLSVIETVEVLQRIDDAVTNDTVTKERRGESRVTFQPVSRIAVLMEGEPIGRRTYMLAPRNLSRSGCSLIHGKFVYPKTACVVGLCARDAQAVPVHSKVIWCRYITGRVHELGIEFTDPIDLSEFVPGVEPD